MHIIRDYHQTPATMRGNVLAIGNFDGLHLGHRAVLNEAKRESAKRNCGVTVLSFEPHPRRFFSAGQHTLRLLPFHLKARLLRDEGVSLLVAQRFNHAFSHINATDFIEQVLIQSLGVAHVVTGEDFVFGHQRGGSSELLKATAARPDTFGYTALGRINRDTHPISSTYIRQLIQSGDMETAAIILGKPYQWLGRVIHGDGRGRHLGFPTANIVPPRVVMPSLGVYAVRVRLWGETLLRPAIANLGVRPTVDGKTPRLEIHLFDCEMDLYNQRLHVEFISFIRPEMVFEGVEALRKQITADCLVARERLTI